MELATPHAAGRKNTAANRITSCRSDLGPKLVDDLVDFISWRTLIPPTPNRIGSLRDEIEVLKSPWLQHRASRDAEYCMPHDAVD
jgi:hypothetical protein